MRVLVHRGFGGLAALASTSFVGFIIAALTQQAQGQQTHSDTTWLWVGVLVSALVGLGAGAVWLLARSATVSTAPFVKHQAYADRASTAIVGTAQSEGQTGGQTAGVIYNASPSPSVDEALASFSEEERQIACWIKPHILKAPQYAGVNWPVVFEKMTRLGMCTREHVDQGYWSFGPHKGFRDRYVLTAFGERVLEKLC